MLSFLKKPSGKSLVFTVILQLRTTVLNVSAANTCAYQFPVAVRSVVNCI